MTIIERLKYLRKDLLKLTQKEFSSKINISRSNFANIENEGVHLTERVIADVCRNFSINRAWLCDGKEPIFVEENNAELSEMISIFKKLDDVNRKYLRGYLCRLLEEQDGSAIRSERFSQNMKFDT